MHPAFDGLAALPYFDEFDLSTVDVLLISQYVHSSHNLRAFSGIIYKGDGIECMEKAYTLEGSSGCVVDDMGILRSITFPTVLPHQSVANCL